MPLHNLWQMHQLSLTKYALRSLVQAYLHCGHSPGLLQRYSRNSWHCDITAAAISSENRRSFSIRNNFPGQLSLFYAAPLASGVAQNRFQEHSPVSIYELCLRSLLANNFRGRPWLQASTGYPVPKVHMLIRQRRFAFYEPIVWNSLLCVTVACHWTDSNGSWKLFIFDSNEHH